jgi:hypothetical protein
MDLTPLQSRIHSFAKYFSRQIFLLYFGKGKFGGKKFTLQKSEFYFAKEFFPFSIRVWAAEICFWAASWPPLTTSESQKIQAEKVRISS